MKECTIINGRQLAARIRTDVQRRVITLSGIGRQTRLDAVLVDGDEAGALYASRQASTCAKVGIEYRLHRLDTDATFDDIAGRVLLLNQDDLVSAVMVHLPLPEAVDTERIQSLIDPEKDIEGVNPANIGRVVYGRRSLVPCTALAVLHMIESTGVELRGKRCVCVGASNIVGKPVAILLMQAEATVVSTNKFTPDLAAECRSADVLVSATGVPGLITGDMIKPGAIVIDVGISRIHDSDGEVRTVGDVNFDQATKVAGYLSPVPGGVGPVTVAILLLNAVAAAEV
ncbi:MAG: bifunctional 5,10-methylenetetrahydrofolate dehydrogenase/5,10-methenyltetrahydrofolate cyclohydrolase [Phycisphaerales bacterium]